MVAAPNPTGQPPAGLEARFLGSSYHTLLLAVKKILHLPGSRGIFLFTLYPTSMSARRV